MNRSARNLCLWTNDFVSGFEGQKSFNRTEETFAKARNFSVPASMCGFGAVGNGRFAKVMQKS